MRKYLVIFITVVTVYSYSYSIGPYGINNWEWDYPLINKAFTEAKMLTNRVIVNWKTAEPEDDNYQWDKSAFLGDEHGSIDVALENFKKYGWKCNIGIWDLTPEWARMDKRKLLSYKPEKFAEFIYELLKHCEQIAPGVVISVEWNELPTQAWNDEFPVTKATDQRDPSWYYADILKATYNTIQKFNKEYNRKVLMVMDSIWQQAFHHLDELYQLGLKDYFDRINFHYYTEAIREQKMELPPTVKNIFHFDTNLLYLRYIADKWGDTNKLIWVTEYGWRHLGEKNKADYNDYVADVCRRSGFVELVQPYVGSCRAKPWDKLDKIALIYDIGDPVIYPTTSYFQYKSYAEKYPVWDKPERDTLKPIPGGKVIELINPGFELGNKKGWDGLFKIDKSTKCSGQYSARITNDGDFIQTKFYSVEPEKLYEITAKVKIYSESVDDAIVDFKIIYLYSDGTVEEILPQNYFGIVNTQRYPNGWRGIIYPEVTPENVEKISVKFDFHGKGIFWIDDFSISPLNLK